MYCPVSLRIVVIRPQLSIAFFSLLKKHDPDTLDFRKDLGNIEAAAQVSAATILSEISGLEGELGLSKRLVGDVGGLEVSNGEVKLETLTFPEFMKVATLAVTILRSEARRVLAKYDDMLSYFGEDPDTPSNDFFNTLKNFGSIFEKNLAEVSYVRASFVREIRGGEDTPYPRLPPAWYRCRSTKRKDSKQSGKGEPTIAKKGARTEKWETRAPPNSNKKKRFILVPLSILDAPFKMAILTQTLHLSSNQHQDSSALMIQRARTLRQQASSDSSSDSDQDFDGSE